MPSMKLLNDGSAAQDDRSAPQSGQRLDSALCNPDSLLVFTDFTVIASVRLNRLKERVKMSEKNVHW